MGQRRDRGEDENKKKVKMHEVCLVWKLCERERKNVGENGNIKAGGDGYLLPDGSSGEV